MSTINTENNNITSSNFYNNNLSGSGFPHKSPRRSDPLDAIRAGDIAQQISDLHSNFRTALSGFHAKQKVLESSMRTLRKEVDSANREKDKEIGFSKELGKVLKQLQQKNRHDREQISNLEKRNVELEAEVVSLRKEVLQKTVETYEIRQPGPSQSPSSQQQYDPDNINNQKSNLNQGLNIDGQIVSSEALLEENKALIMQLIQKEENNQTDEEMSKLRLELQTREPLVKRLKDRLRAIRYENQELQQELQRMRDDLRITESDLEKLPATQQENSVLNTRLKALQDQYDKLKKENTELRTKVGIS